MPIAVGIGIYAGASGAAVAAPPSGSAYHLDFVGNVAWQGTTQLGPVSNLLSGTLRLSASGLTVQAGDNYQFAAGILTLVKTNLGSVTVTGSGISTTSGARIIGLNGTKDLIEVSDLDTVGTWNTANFLTADAGSGTLAGTVKLGMSFSDAGAGRSLVFNNGVVTTDANALNAAGNTAIYLGGDGGTSGYATGLYTTCTFYSTKLSDVALKALTV